MKAAEKGNRDVVELLISKGADTKAKDRFGRTALSYAQTDEVKKLLKK